MINQDVADQVSPALPLPEEAPDQAAPSAPEAGPPPPIAHPSGEAVGHGDSREAAENGGGEKDSSGAQDNAGSGDSPDAARDAASGADEPAPAAGTRRRVTRQQLEEEGDIAADYLEELLDIVDLDGDIDIDVENDRAAISIVGDGVAQRSLKRLVGDGEVLDAVQELTRLAVQTKTGERSRLMLDIARFRAHRKEELEHVAHEAITRQRADNHPVHLDPMTPFERKVVHDVVAAAGLRSESEGDGDNRHVVITSLS